MPSRSCRETSAGSRSGRRATRCASWSASRACCAGERVDLFHAPHYVLPFALPCPAVVTVHDLIHLRFPEHHGRLALAYARWMIGRAVRQARRVLTVSESTAADLEREFGAPREKLVVAPNGVDERFRRDLSEAAVGATLARHELRPGYLLFVGNPKPHKNLGRLLEAYARLVRRASGDAAAGAGRRPGGGALAGRRPARPGGARRPRAPARTRAGRRPARALPRRDAARAAVALGGVRAAGGGGDGRRHPGAGGASRRAARGGGRGRGLVRAGGRRRSGRGALRAARRRSPPRRAGATRARALGAASAGRRRRAAPWRSTTRCSPRARKGPARPAGRTRGEPPAPRADGSGGALGSGRARARLADRAARRRERAGGDRARAPRRSDPHPLPLPRHGRARDRGASDRHQLSPARARPRPRLPLVPAALSVRAREPAARRPPARRLVEPLRGQGARSAPGGFHLCYCHTPMRYAWDQEEAYFGGRRLPLRLLQRLVLAALRRWDVATAGRVDRYLANSRFVAGRIERHYRRSAEVLPPPVDTDYFTPVARRAARARPGGGRAGSVQKSGSGDRRPAKPPAGRWSWSGTDRSVRASSGWRARSTRFAGWVDRERLRELYRGAQVFLQPGVEDFGIAAVEALACGTPVVALGERRGARHRDAGRARAPRSPEPRSALLRSAIDKLRRDAVQFREPQTAGGGVFRRAVRQRLREIIVSCRPAAEGDWFDSTAASDHGRCPTSPAISSPRWRPSSPPGSSASRSRSSRSPRAPRTSTATSTCCRSCSSSCRSSSTSTASTSRGRAAAGWTKRSPSLLARAAGDGPALRRSSPGTARRRARQPRATSPTAAPFLGAVRRPRAGAGGRRPRRESARCCTAPACTRGNPQRILVVGAGKLGPRDHREAAGAARAGLEVVGFLDDDPGKLGRRYFDGAPVLGSHARPRARARRAQDRPGVRRPAARGAQEDAAGAAGGRIASAVEVKLVPDILQYATIKATLEDLDGTPVINLSQVPLQGWSSLVKRAWTSRCRPPG